MRMWNVDPRGMCDSHLLGEHVETHMFAGSMLKGRSVKGYVDGGLLEIHTLGKRHDQLAAEMERRGMNHQSPFPERLGQRTGHLSGGAIDRQASLDELHRRCGKCRRRWLADSLVKR